MKIAIIGSGISGLTSAYLLNRNHDITVFEANDYIGGHTHTHNIKIKNKSEMDSLMSPSDYEKFKKDNPN